jgi:hypothetical protein
LRGSKEVNESTPKGTAIQQEESMPEATMSDTTGIVDTVGDFEEEEGVQQESPPQYDY